MQLDAFARAIELVLREAIVVKAPTFRSSET